MALIESKKADHEQTFPSFELKNTNDINTHSNELMGNNGLVILFTCNHCPYAKALWDRTIRDFSIIQQAGFNIIAINPNIHPDYPEDSFEQMVQMAADLNIPYPYLVDETQSIARAYDAQCTPDLYVLNQQMKLIYRGAYDDHWKDASLVTEPYLLNALNAYQDNPTITIPTKKPSIGCSIKWVNDNLSF